MPPSQRVTRSAAARLSADGDSISNQQQSPTTTAAGSPPASTTTSSSSTKRKRKAAPQPSPPATERKTKRPRGSNAAATNPDADQEQPEPVEAPKRGKKRAASAAMSSAGSAGPSQKNCERKTDMDRPSSDNTSAETSPQQAPRDSSRRKSSRRKSKEDPTASTSGASSRKSRKGSRKDQDVVMKDVDEKGKEPKEDADDDEEQSRQDAGTGAEGSEEPSRRQIQDEIDAMERGEDPFATGYLSRFAGHHGLSSSLRALSGIVSGTNSRLRGLLERLRAKDDPSMQLIALQDLSELLLVSNEDNLAGHFAPDQYVKELVTLMQPNDFTGEENPEVMLLACRCIANMMEALPAATASVVYGRAVPILCQKLLEIHYIDLAEQALSTLEKISVEFPSSIVREGGLTACLTYLDFFATGTQRTAVTTAANCCRNIPEDSFPTVRDVMPILLGTLSSSDQRVVEQASLCVARIIDSFKYHEGKLEELISPELLRAILRLLLPGSTNMIGPNIHTQFLRVLSITARASPRLSVELFKMNVVDTLYQILTGVSPPAGTDGVAAKIDKNVIMQSIIRTPREQIFETLNVVCELLPTVSPENLTFLDDLQDAGYTGSESVSMSTRSKTSPNDKRVELLKECTEEVKRFAVILFPTLMHAYTSTVNLSVRQKVLTAQLKMLSNLETGILEEALQGVTYASHLAGILTQQENSSLVTYALQAAELLLKRLELVYRPQFYREGVIAEVTKLADRPMAPGPTPADLSQPAPDLLPPPPPEVDEQPGDIDQDEEDDEQQAIEVDVAGEATDEDDNAQDENEPHEDNENDEDDEDDEDREAQRVHSDDSELPPTRHRRIPNLQDIITLRSKRFMEAHGDEGSEEMRSKATKVLDDIKSVSSKLQSCYNSADKQGGLSLYRQLARYFRGDALEGITSYELLTSGIVDTLLELFASEDEDVSQSAQADFLEAFMGTSIDTNLATGASESPSTAFSILIYKLQELLSRAEHFEVITVHHNAFESNRGSAASMLAKQLRLKLVAGEESGIPRAYRNIMVSIHAIATFKALDDYLRPRISLSERPRGARREGGISSAMAAYAAAMAGRGDRSAPPIPSLPSLGRSLPARPSNKLPPRTKSSKSDSNGEASKPEDAAARSLRRSTRRQSGQPSAAPDAEPDAPTEDKNDLQEALEAADEAHISDEDDDDDVDADLDALVDDLEEGGLEQDVADPGAVNIEAAGTGKVTARTEDGARVSTPTAQGVPTPTGRDRMSAIARLAAAREMLSTPTSSRPGMSYASALQATPQDWHIEFSVNGQPISSETTIYRACHFNQAQGDELSARNIWSATHSISFKRVSGPPPADRATPTVTTTASSSTDLPPSLDNHPVTSSILRLMSILHELNANPDDVVHDAKSAVKLNAEPQSQFVNTKLTAKLNRQLEEPLIVASQCLPSWSEDLARLYPFLFPFETRHLFLQSTSFGYSRLMSRWQSSQSESESRRHRDDRPFLGRMQRQKVRISRGRILESALKVMELYGSSSSMLEVEYFEEVGTGLGPTLEFYSTVSKEFSKKKTKLWRENESFENDEFAFGKRGLFPAPMNEETSRNENGQRVLHLFKMLGKFVARSMLDSRIIDISFNPTFFRIGDSTAVAPSLGAVATVDEDLAKSLKMLKKYATTKQRIDEDIQLSAAQKLQKTQQIRVNDAKVEDLGLGFTLPGYPDIELLPHGSTIDVTIDNVDLYIKKVIDFTLGAGIEKQVEAFRAGFSQVFPYSATKAFTPDELVMLFGRVDEDWSLETLMDSIKADHGFNLDSKSVRNLLQFMSELPAPTRRDFLQFITGSPKLPIGGFKALTPMFTVVCKPSEPPYTSDDYLPSVMTCVNYLKMPDYSSLDILKEKLNVAIKEGQGAFHLS
ncbi:putative ubiquitin fusion degradation protein [Fulvia fulva]|uniref:HECT-type E3 ubiquitin transferase n=1 Tax=Passalora fulva TaxID=5499 RepID=A0A9Q8L859_PASFU|nr:putative ubiquitin fusion degradation protein [Fulvia fulva]KAK4634501.1 putative ubiquitin fusion degradation protein [Fulvia fulva]KAK4636727.1 putative ubiquitin fusion degradation protein [Fulvia fulva]UJO12637.1 putative ubiquitin fusion degradation protein [Fulvia fulva]WPV08296.1 putative ubiquitin fusion degradation protein [Fulvia fulva]WPV24636.1 putative ubiquitin fusion degradation protein [Fulvia fulva]